MKFLQLNFLPRSADAGLLVLRLWFGLAMALLHGWPKLKGFSRMADGFSDPLGVGNAVSLGLAIFAEFVCSLLIVLGLFARLAAIVGMVTMGVAFWMIHKAALSGPQSGELAFAYLGVFFVLLIAGPGRYSVDGKMGAKV